MLSKDYVGVDKDALISSLTELSSDSVAFLRNLGKLASKHPAPNLLIGKINFLLRNMCKIEIKLNT